MFSNCRQVMACHTVTSENNKHSTGMSFFERMTRRSQLPCRRFGIYLKINTVCELHENPLLPYARVLHQNSKHIR